MNIKLTDMVSRLFADSKGLPAMDEINHTFNKHSLK